MSWLLKNFQSNNNHPDTTSPSPAVATSPHMQAQAPPNQRDQQHQLLQQLAMAKSSTSISWNHNPNQAHSTSQQTTHEQQQQQQHQLAALLHQHQQLQQHQHQQPINTFANGASTIGPNVMQQQQQHEPQQQDIASLLRLHLTDSASRGEQQQQHQAQNCQQQQQHQQHQQLDMLLMGVNALGNNAMQLSTANYGSAPSPQLQPLQQQYDLLSRLGFLPMPPQPSSPQLSSSTNSVQTRLGMLLSQHPQGAQQLLQSLLVQSQQAPQPPHNCLSASLQGLLAQQGSGNANLATATSTSSVVAAKLEGHNTRKRRASGNHEISNALLQNKEPRDRTESTRSTSHLVEEDNESAGDKLSLANSNKIRKRQKKKDKDMPKRPLSAYNLFFRDERVKMASIPRKQSKEAKDHNAENGEVNNDESIPRKRKKSCAKVGFENLARSVAQRWRTLDDERMKHYKGLAAVDAQRYNEEMNVYRRRFLTKEQQEARKKESDDGEEDDEDESCTKDDSEGSGRSSNDIKDAKDQPRPPEQQKQQQEQQFEPMQMKAKGAKRPPAFDDKDQESTLKRSRHDNDGSSDEVG